MSNGRGWLRKLALAGAALVPVTAAAQQAPALVQSSTGVAAVVNEAVISNYDLDQRTALFLATSGVRATNENLPQIRGEVLRSLEDEVIETQEAAKRRITASRPELEKALQNIAADNKFTVDQLLAKLGQAGVSSMTFIQQVNTQLIWQKLVAARYGTDIAISDQQVDEAMDRLKQGADKPQFLISEIYLGVDRPEDETKVRASAEQIAEQVMMGAPFQTVASQFSQSPSAADGGDIGWVVEGQLADELDRALLTMQPGQVTKPIRAEGGYYVLLLRDRREPQGAKADAQPPPPPDPNAPVPLDRLLIPLPANADMPVKTRALALAANVKNTVRKCADLPAVASQLQGSVYTSLGTIDPKVLNPELRAALAMTGPGEAVEPFFSPAGVELIMRCDARAAGFSAFALPTREELRQQLVAQQMSVYAKTYLRDLRRDAIVFLYGR